MICMINHMITRNISHFKKVNRYETTEEDDYSDGEAKKTNSKVEPRFRRSQR